MLAAVLVNLPLLHSTWTDHRVERSGVDVHATVVEHRTVGGQHLLTFTFPASIDPDQRTWQADVDAATYDRPSSAASSRSGSSRTTRRRTAPTGRWTATRCW